MLERPFTEFRNARYVLRVIQRKARLRRRLRSDFVRDGAIVFASTMIVNIVSYAIHFALSRKLGVTDYGVFASLVSVLSIVGLPGAIMSLIVVKFVAELHAVNDRAKIRLLALRIMTFGGAIGFIFIFLAALLRQPFGTYLRLTDTRTLVAAALTLAMTFALPAIRGVLQGTQDFMSLAISTSIEAILRFGLAVALASAGWGVSGVFLGYVLAGVVSFVYTIIAVRKHFGKASAKLTIDWRRLLQSTGGIVAGTSAITLLTFIDLPLVKHFFDPKQAGIYGAVTICGKMLFFAIGFIPTLVLPKAAGRAARGESAASVLRHALALTFALAFVGLALFLFAPQLVVRLTYGAAFLGAAKYIFAYGIAMSLLGMTYVIVTYKIGLHRFDFVVPLLVAVVLETGGIYAFHATLWSVVSVVAGVAALSLIFCAVKLPQVLTQKIAVPRAAASGEAARF